MTFTVDTLFAEKGEMLPEFRKMAETPRSMTRVDACIVLFLKELRHELARKGLFPSQNLKGIRHVVGRVRF